MSLTKLEKKPAPVKVPDVEPIGTESFSGLCMTCNHAPQCVHCMESATVILQCEQFEDHMTVAAATPKTASKPSVPIASERAMGLCVNCECREVCTLPKPQGGVWHCNEYA